MLTNHEQLDQARVITLECRARRFLHVDAIFKFHEKNILTKDGKPQRNDTSNRIKALHDVLAAILGIDDSYFWSLACDKKVTLDTQDECVDVTIVVADL